MRKEGQVLEAYAGGRPLRKHGPKTRCPFPLDHDCPKGKQGQSARTKTDVDRKRSVCVCVSACRVKG